MRRVVGGWGGWGGGGWVAGMGVGGWGGGGLKQSSTATVYLIAYLGAGADDFMDSWSRGALH